MLKLLGSFLAVIVGFLGLGFVGLINSHVDWKLRPTIRRAKHEIKRLARLRCPDANVFSFGATKIDPRHLAIWVTTKTDEQRDRLCQDSDFQQKIRETLLDVGYPASAVPLVHFAFESQETIDRDFGGNWYYATK